ncbi:MAG TPA: HEAT repeat domain-containing protein, partial [Pyrinomonadaceae bacterium]|nr:HEAT repeat domain-containing protein [Pyrinomonadaceae bacterium]
MNPNVTKLNPVAKTFALAVVLAFGLSQQVVAQKYSHRPKRAAFTQQGSNNAAATTTFNTGRDLIDDAQWARAEEKFAQYISAYPQEKNLDAAMYWMAYAQSKLKKYNQSKDTIEKLLKTYDKTVWKEDAELLLAQLPGPVAVKVDPVTVTVEPVLAVPVPVPAPVVAVPQNPVDVQIRTAEMQQRIAEAQARSAERMQEAQERMAERMAEAKEKMKDKDFNFNFNYDFDHDFSVGPMKVGKGSGDDDPSEFKIMVLQALCESDPVRCVSVANDWLKPNSGQTVACRRAALTLLARHGGKAATPTILSVAQNEAEDLKVRQRAISLLGASNDETVIAPLRNFALNAPQNEISEPALSALGQHNSPQALTALADIAASNKPLPMRKFAIRSISQRPGEPAVDALFRIYDSTQDLEIRKSVIGGFGNRKSERAGTKLAEIAGSNDNVELRKAAITAIARRGGDTAVETLMRLYDSEKNEEMKDHIMNSFGYLQDKRVTDKLIAIARN